jgi:hypothetical protein
LNLALHFAIVVSTFIVKDVLRDKAKDLVDSLEATYNVWLLSENIDDVQKGLDAILYKLQKEEVVAVTDSQQKTKVDIANAEHEFTVTELRSGSRSGPEERASQCPL